ncbi:MAG: hypothetical protein HXS44_00335, partial [Theionarchaea archaeon]|nr:hypothetical protein [Theionarchaea archaeon]
MKWNLLRRGSTEVVFVVIVVLLLGLLPIMIMPVKGGTLSLTKGSWDCVGLDHNNVLDGPNQYVIQIHITNTAGVTALSVSGTLAWTTANTYINLGPNES